MTSVAVKQQSPLTSPCTDVAAAPRCDALHAVVSELSLRFGSRAAGGAAGLYKDKTAAGYFTGVATALVRRPCDWGLRTPPAG